MKKIITFVILLCIASITKAQNKHFTLFDNIENLYPFDIAKTLDNNIVLVGTKTQPQSLANKDGLILSKINNEGANLFSVAYDSMANKDGINAVLATSDSNFVCVGSTLSYNNGNTSSDIWVVKLSKTGAYIWSKHIDCGNTPEAALDIIEDPNGGYVISANTDFIGALGGEQFVLKMDVSGNVVWKTKVNVPSKNNEGRYLAKCPNHFYVSGFHGVFSTTVAMTTLVKMDYSGNVLWYKDFDVTGNYNSTLTGISPTADGGCIISSTNTIQKVSSNGTSVWSYNYSSIVGIELGKTIELSSGGYLATANGRLMKFDENMNTLWIHSFSGCINAAYELIEMPNSNYCFVSKVNSTAIIPGMINPRGAIIQTDSNGFSSCGTTVLPNSDLVLFVNPPTIANITYTTSNLAYPSNLSYIPNVAPASQFLPKCGFYDAGVTEIITPDSSILCNVNQSLKIKIKNFSSTLPLPQAKVKYNLNGVVSTTTTYTLNLAPNADTSIIVGNLTLNNGTNQLSTWAWYDPTFTVDFNSLNDTLHKTILVGNANNGLSSNLPINNFTINACLGDAVQLFTTANFSNMNYQWQQASTINGPFLNIGGQNNSLIALTPTLTRAYRLIVSDQFGACNIASDTLLVQVASITTSIQANGNTTFCAGDSLTLNSTIANVLSYQWYLNNSPILGATNSSYQAYQSGTYKLKTTYTTGGCSGMSNSIIVTVIPFVNAAITSSGSTSICAGNSLQLNCNNATTYTWYQNGAILSGSPFQNYITTQSGNYYCVVNYANCPDTSNTITVTVNPIPATPTIAINNLVLSTPVTGVNYQWYLNGVAISGATNATYSPTQNGQYSLKVESQGCWSQMSVSITVLNVGTNDISLNPKLQFFPNPSSDGIFTMKGDLYKFPIEYQVFSTTGTLIKGGQLTAANKTINLNQASKGIYIIKYRVNNIQQVEMLVK